MQHVPNRPARRDSERTAFDDHLLAEEFDAGHDDYLDRCLFDLRQSLAAFGNR
jgi:hypothetical protein